MMAVADPSLSMEFGRPLSSPRQPRTLTPIKRPLHNSLQRPFLDPSLQTLPSIESPTGTQMQVVLKPDPPHAPNDYIPLDLLQTLKRHSHNATVSPRGRQRHPTLPKTGPSVSTGGVPIAPKIPPANLWNYSSRRSKLKHLTEAPPCVCGAGRDISFLYDANNTTIGGKETTSGNTLPNTLVPEEYRLVKHPGVLGLEYHNDPYVIRSEDHDHHMTVFPSMRPAGRHEAVTLKHTLETMLRRAGVPSELKDSDMQGPTVMHNLLELLQKEQAIYNICFHELIRQVSVHCVERGELLADVRRRYNNLLDRIPRQIKSLHDELVAQRALDRKLSTELKRFKGKVSNLTDELSSIKEHDLHVTEQSRTAEDNLILALADSEKNSNLLAEYHALYELQRNRIDEQVSNLTFERDLWQQGSYDLASRVAEENSLKTLQRIQLCEKSWCKLGGHFAVLLSDKDTQQLSEIQSYVQRWRERVVEVTFKMLNIESRMRERIDKVETGMQRWIEILDKLINAEEGGQGPSRSQTEQLFSDIKLWEDIVNQEADNFSGVTLLDCQEELSSLQSLVDKWTEVALLMFNRHQGEGTQSPENKRMLELNTAVDRGLKVYAERLSGENGVATGFIRIMTPLETWDNKLGLCVATHDKQLPLSDWVKFCTILKDWVSQVRYIISCIGTNHQAKPPRGGDSEEEEEEEVEEVAPLNGLLGEADKWRAALSHAIDSSDTLVTEQVRRLHSSLVKWMVELLLKLTDTPVQPEKAQGHRQHIVTTADLRADYTRLVETLTSFTKMLTRQCLDVVRDIVDQRVAEDYPNPEEEQTELKRLGDEGNEWVRLAGLLLEEADTAVETDAEGGGKESEKETVVPSGAESAVVPEEVLPEDLPETMSVVGIDDNIHPKPLQQVIDETEPPPLLSSADLGLDTEDAMPEGRDTRREDVEALIVNLDQANKKLQEQEELTHKVEERAASVEKDLEDAKSKIVELETELQQAKEALEQQRKNSDKNSRKNSKKSAATRPTSRK